MNDQSRFAVTDKWLINLDDVQAMSRTSDGGAKLWLRGISKYLNVGQAEVDAILAAVPVNQNSPTEDEIAGVDSAE